MIADLRISAQFIWRHRVALFGVLWPLFVLQMTVDLVYVFSKPGSPLGTLFNIGYMLIYPYFIVRLLGYLTQCIEPAANPAPWGWFLWMQLTIQGLLYGFILVAGLLFFIVPGLIVLARFAYADIELYLHRLTATEGLKASFNYTEGWSFQILQGYLVLWMPVIVLGFLIESKLPSYPTLYLLNSTAENFISMVTLAWLYTYLFRLRDVRRASS